ncbi:MAG: hypothetical protein L3J08_09480 [Flavobacteriaceae bacterium]|nr:hypothetical protein [Flavobacteriaceae bacterium]
MNNKKLFLIASIITFAVFIGYLTEPGPHSMFGYSINIWFVRFAWLIISVTNITNYLKLRKSER